MLSRLLCLALVAGLALGCSSKKDAPPVADLPPVTNPANVQPVDTAQAFAYMHVPFRDATLAEPPERAKRPPDMTSAGKNVGKMYEQIAGLNGNDGLWDQIRFVTAEGKRIRYSATIKTDLGNVEMEFFPETAPNHVRNFIALAKVGYYDGLAFDMMLNQKVDDQPWRMLLAGCPLGTAEAGHGSIGYWLPMEYSEKQTHEAGTIGAWHDEALDSAACKFYITLTKAPWLDTYYTVFGRVSEGLDIVRQIAEKPLQREEGLPKGNDAERSGRFQQPVVIRSVTIHTKVE